MATTYTLSTTPARAGSALLKAKPAKPVILADGCYYCDAPADAGEAAELLAGLIADEAERVAAAIARDAA